MGPILSIIAKLGPAARQAVRRSGGRTTGPVSRTGGPSPSRPPQGPGSAAAQKRNGGGMSRSTDTPPTTTGPDKPSWARRAGQSLAPGGDIRKWTKRGTRIGLGVGAVDYAGRAIFDSSPVGALFRSLTGGDSTEPLNFDAALSPVLSRQPTESQADRFNRYFVGTEETPAQFPFQQPTIPDFVGTEQGFAARDLAELENYLRDNRLYSTNQAQAISDAYQGMSQNLLQSSDDIFQRGQVTAGSIDQLYDTLAAENSGTSYGEGLSTPVSDVGGLAAPAGDMVSAADTTRTYGRSLADYLGQEAGIESAALEQVAGSQALQGAALAQSLRDYVRMAETDARRQLGRELTARERDAMQRRSETEFQMELQQQDYQRQLAQQLFGFEREDTLEARMREEQRNASAAAAANFWATARGDQKKLLERIVEGKKGQEGLEAFVKFISENPEYLTAIGG